MSYSPRFLARRASLALACCASLPLGGCFIGPTAKATDGLETNKLTPKAFTPFVGSFTSTGLISRSVANANTQSASFSLPKGTEAVQVRTGVGDVDAAGKQQVDVTVEGMRGFSRASGRIESNGVGYKGDAALAMPDGTPTGDYVRFTNAPGASLDLSLGAPSLAYSYVGQGGIGTRAEGSSGDMVSYAFAMFGGSKTTDMPTTGKADYVGTFEGREQRALNGGAKITTQDLSGQVRLSADFAQGQVNGQVSSLNAHSAAGKTPVSYNIGFGGSISGSGFAGAAFLQETSNKPAWHNTGGALQGGFFGPKAAETAGALALTAQDGQQKLLVTGAFGAKKQ
jgi:hypothetical protein